MDNQINLVLRKYFGTFVAEEDDELVGVLNMATTAIYQIERAIAQIKDAERYNSTPELEVKYRSMIALSVQRQLEAFLESIKINNKESP